MTPMVRIDGAGLTIDGCGADLDTALARCRAAGHAQLVLAADAPSGACVALADALNRAGVTVASAHRNARRTAPGYTRDGRTIVRDGQPIVMISRVDLGDQRFAITPYETDQLVAQIVDLLNGKRRRQGGRPTTHRIFVFRLSLSNGHDVRTRWFEADPPVTWDEAKRRIVAAGLLDERLIRPTEWKLVADPPLRVPTDRLRPLP